MAHIQPYHDTWINVEFQYFWSDEHFVYIFSGQMQQLYFHLNPYVLMDSKLTEIDKPPSARDGCMIQIWILYERIVDAVSFASLPARTPAM